MYCRDTHTNNRCVPDECHYLSWPVNKPHVFMSGGEREEDLRVCKKLCYRFHTHAWYTPSENKSSCVNEKAFRHTQPGKTLNLVCKQLLPHTQSPAPPKLFKSCTTPGHVFVPQIFDKYYTFLQSKEIVRLHKNYWMHFHKTWWTDHTLVKRGPIPFGVDLRLVYLSLILPDRVLFDIYTNFPGKKDLSHRGDWIHSVQLGWI